MNNSEKILDNGHIVTKNPRGHTIVRFGNVAQKINKIVDPLTSGLSCYVEGGDIRSEDLQIKTWSNIGNGYLGPAFNHKFVKGQILYISRNPHLRKVAIPHFDGVCANTTFVIEPQGNDVIPELIPFIMQSETFVQHTMRKAKGSTNPYINWKDLACYEFVVPDKQKQLYIATLFLAAENCLIMSERFFAAAVHLKRILIRELFSKGIGQSDFKKTKNGLTIPKNWELKSLGLLSDIKGGIQKSKDRVPKENPRRYLTVAHVQRNFIRTDDPRYFEMSDTELEQYRLVPGDVLVVEANGSIDELGRSAIFNGEIENCIFQNMIIRIRPKDNLLDFRYLNHFLNSSRGHESLTKMGMSSSGLFHIGVNRLMSIELPVGTLDEQRKIAAILTRCDETIAAARMNVATTKALKMRLINEMLKPEING